MGFICEGVIALRNIPYFEETDKYTLNTITDLQSASFILLLSIFCLKVDNLGDKFVVLWRKGDRILSVGTLLVRKDGKVNIDLFDDN